MTFIGIDGCKAGWLLIALNKNGQAEIEVIATIQGLSGWLPAAQIALIDIPIGLRGAPGTARCCDRAARTVLAAGRKGSVFPAPVRAAIKASSYAEANELNRACSGKGLPIQCYGIVPKIREVDDFMRVYPLRHKLREMHPEVAFWALNQRQPMRTSKKTPAGFKERMQVLSQHCPAAGAIVDAGLKKYLRKQVARDDIVDALVGAITARYSTNLASFPASPEFDDLGLPMEIVYWAGR